MDNFPSILSPPGTSVNPRNRRPGIGFGGFAHFSRKLRGFELKMDDFWKSQPNPIPGGRKPRLAGTSTR